MNVLVSGVAGFIGSRLAEQLLAEGNHVTGVDSFTPYYPQLIKRHNLTKLVLSGKFTFIESSIVAIDEHALGDIEVVFHLAGQPGVRTSFGGGFAGYLESNVAATQALLEKLKHAPKLKRLVFASSSSVYGETASHRLKENMLPRPVSPYGVTKLAAEHLCDLYSGICGFTYVALRYFTVYGPHQRPDMAMYRFFHALSNGEAITLYGDGGQMRDFTFVDDTVRATVAAGVADIPGRSIVINVGSGTSITIRRVLECMSDVTGKTPNIVHRDPEHGDMTRTLADIDRAGKILRYKPTVFPHEGLSAEYEWFCEHARFLESPHRMPGPLTCEVGME